jgi:exodeoxyribonuclease VII small subunit
METMTSPSAADPGGRAATGVADDGAADRAAVDDIAGFSFEQARDELVRVVAELEQGAPTLEESLALWVRGEALAARCEQWLLGAKRRLDAARGESAQTGTATDRSPSGA